MLLRLLRIITLNHLWEAAPRPSSFNPKYKTICFKFLNQNYVKAGRNYFLLPSYDISLINQVVAVLCLFMNELNQINWMKDTWIIEQVKDEWMWYTRGVVKASLLTSLVKKSIFSRIVVLYNMYVVGSSNTIVQYRQPFLFWSCLYATIRPLGTICTDGYTFIITFII